MPASGGDAVRHRSLLIGAVIIVLTVTALHTVLLFTFLHRWVESPPLIFYILGRAEFVPLWIALDIATVTAFVALAREMLGEDRMLYFVFYCMIASFFFVHFMAAILRLMLLLFSFLGMTAACLSLYTNLHTRRTLHTLNQYSIPSPSRRTPQKAVTPRMRVKKVGVRATYYIERDSLTGREIVGNYVYRCPNRGDHVFDERSVKEIRARYGGEVCPFCEGFPKLRKERKEGESIS